MIILKKTHDRFVTELKGQIDYLAAQRDDVRKDRDHKIHVIKAMEDDLYDTSKRLRKVSFQRNILFVSIVFQVIAVILYKVL